MTASLAIAMLLGTGAAVEDLRRRRVPNWLTLPAATCALAAAACSGWRPLALAAAGLAIGFLILLPFHWCGAMGGGDVKLMAAYGALLGPSGILLAGLFAAVFGALLAAAATLRKPGAETVPYAPAIVLGAWISLLGGGV